MGGGGGGRGRRHCPCGGTHMTRRRWLCMECDLHHDTLARLGRLPLTCLFPWDWRGVYPHSSLKRTISLPDNSPTFHPSSLFPSLPPSLLPSPSPSSISRFSV